MKKFILTTITAAVLATSTLASGVTTTLITPIASVNQISEVNKMQLEILQKLVVDSGGIFQTTTVDGVFESLNIKKDNLSITIKNDSTVFFFKNGKKVTATLAQVIQEFNNI